MKDFVNYLQEERDPAIRKPDEDEGVTDSRGIKRWRNKKGQLHRDNDLPAIRYPGGTEEYYQNDKLHRDNGPAIHKAGSQFNPGGEKVYYKHGKLTNMTTPREENWRGKNFVDELGKRNKK